MTPTTQISQLSIFLAKHLRALTTSALLVSMPVCVLAADVVAPHQGPRTISIVITAMKFVPESVEVHPGDTVIWTNKDPFPHTVLAQQPGFHSPEIGTGQSWKFKVSKIGVIGYICSLHTTMKGTVVVK